MQTKNFEVTVSPSSIEIRLRLPDMVLSRVQRAGFPLRDELRAAVKVARKVLERERKLAMDRISRDTKLLYLSVSPFPKAAPF